jgi:hypothetical protein
MKQKIKERFVDFKRFISLMNILNDQHHFDLQKESKHGSARIQDHECQNLSISEYIYRIAIYSGASPYSFVLSLLYIERFRRVTPEPTLESKGLKSLMLVAVMITEKFFEDSNYTNREW